ncbi:MAG: transposase [Thermoanaerobaculia bacterium]
MLQDGFFDPKKPLVIRWDDLPHWRQDGATYFVTFRLGDSLPETKLAEWRRERDLWRDQHRHPTHEEVEEFERRHRGKIERWLDQGAGCCLLAREPARSIVEEALRFFDGSKYELGEHTVAPNHVHVVARMADGIDLSEVLVSWKRHATREIRLVPALATFLPDDRYDFWQRGAFDHIVRNMERLEKINAYIRSHEAGNLEVREPLAIRERPETSYRVVQVGGDL